MFFGAGHTLPVEFYMVSHMQPQIRELILRTVECLQFPIICCCFANLFESL